MLKCIIEMIDIVDGGRSPNFINMDKIEDQYLVLPLHHKITLDNVKFICSITNEGW